MSTNLLLQILLWLVIGGIIGWLAGIIMGSRGSLLSNIILGIVGAVVGGFIARNVFHTGADILSLPGILIAIAGACLVIFILRLIGR